MQTIDYNIFTLGFNKFLSKGSSALESSIEQIIDDLPMPSIMGSGFIEIPPSQIGSGEIGGNLTMIAGLLKSANYVSGSAGWAINYDGSAEFSDITLYGGTIKYGKTSFTDSTNAGYWIGALGLYIGGADDITKLKYTVGDGTLSFIGRLQDSAGVVILDSSTKTILKDFTFSSDDYSGAFKTGDIAWNSNTGEITEGSGGLFNKAGLIFATNGVATIILNGITGAATFTGTITGSTITGGTIQTATSGQRIVLTSTADALFKAYDSDNNNVIKFADISGGALSNINIYGSEVGLLIQEQAGAGGGTCLSLSSNQNFTKGLYIAKSGSGYPFEISTVGLDSVYIHRTMDSPSTAKPLLNLLEDSDTYYSTLQLNKFIEVYNSGDMDSPKKTGSATATTANHLVDTTNSQFSPYDSGRRVKNTTDGTTTQVKSYNSSSDLTLYDDIFASGENYEILGVDNRTSGLRIGMASLTDDISHWATTLAIDTYGWIVDDNPPAADRTIPIRVNGTIYYLLAATTRN